MKKVAILTVFLCCACIWCARVKERSDDSFDCTTRPISWARFRRFCLLLQSGVGPSKLSQRQLPSDANYTVKHVINRDRLQMAFCPCQPRFFRIAEKVFEQSHLYVRPITPTAAKAQGILLATYCNYLAKFLSSPACSSPCFMFRGVNDSLFAAKASLILNFDLDFCLVGRFFLCLYYCYADGERLVFMTRSS